MMEFFFTTGHREFLPHVDNDRRFWVMPDGRDLEWVAREAAAEGRALRMPAGKYHMVESKEYTLRYAITPTLSKLSATLRRLWGQ